MTTWTDQISKIIENVREDLENPSSCFFGVNDCVLTRDIRFEQRGLRLYFYLRDQGVASCDVVCGGEVKTSFSSVSDALADLRRSTKKNLPIMDLLLDECKKWDGFSLPKGTQFRIGVHYSPNFVSVVVLKTGRWLSIYYCPKNEEIRYRTQENITCDFEEARAYMQS